MVRKVLKRVYLQFLSIQRQYIYYIIPNIFTKANCTYDNLPVFQQRTIITGNGRVKIGKNCSFGFKPGGFWRNGCIELQPRVQNAQIIIGANLSTNNNIFICAMNKISIGSDVLIGQNVSIMDFEAHGVPATHRRQIGEIGEITIEDNVWIGSNVLILKNSIIGKNSIVAAGAVVSGKFPNNVIIGGVPAKIIKKLV